VWWSPSVSGTSSTPTCVTDEQAAFYDPGVYSSCLGRNLDHEEYLVAKDLYIDLLPGREAEERDVVLLIAGAVAPDGRLAGLRL
jgi:hypothetical protein